jgi:uncharacterized protein YdhG (YjbR/CyaY superfamily)
MAKRAMPSGSGEAGKVAVDAYLAEAPEAHRMALQALRSQVRSLAPDAIEGISYGIPGFKYRGRGLVWYASFKAHCSFFPGGTAEDYAADLPGYTIAKGTIQFTPDHPLPTDVVERIVRDRMASIDSGGR